MSQSTEPVFEIVSTSSGRIYYEFVVRGEVENAKTGEKIKAGPTNDAISSGLRSGTQIVRGMTGNVGYGDAYRVMGEIIYFGRTGGDGDVMLRLDGQRVQPSDLRTVADPTRFDPPVYIEREVTETFEIVATEEGPVLYEFFVETAGEVEGTKISATIKGDNKNDAISSGGSPDLWIVRGFTGNTGHGDAYRFDGTLLAFSRDGPAAATYRIDGQEYSLAELSKGTSGDPTALSDADPYAAFRTGIQTLEALANDPGGQDERTWYNQVRWQLQRVQAAMGQLLEAGYRFDTEVGDTLRIRVVQPDSSAQRNSVLGSQRRTAPSRQNKLHGSALSFPFVTGTALLVGTVGMMKTSAAAGAALKLGAAGLTASGVAYLGGQFPTAAPALNKLFANNAYLFLLSLSPVTNPAVRTELGCEVATRTAGLLAEDSDLDTAAHIIADQLDGCEFNRVHMIEYALDVLAETAGSEDDPSLPRLVESVTCESIENEWHAIAEEHHHSHRYQDARARFYRSRDDRVYLWVNMKNVPPDTYTFTWFAPSGQKNTSRDSIREPDSGDRWQNLNVWGYMEISSGTELGRWSVELSLGGRTVASRSFYVYA